MSKLSENLKEARKRLNLAQSDVVKLTSIESVQVLSNYENGQREPRLSTLCELADLYNMSLDNLVGRKVYPAKEYLDDFERIGISTEVISMAYNFPAFAGLLNWLCSNPDERILPEVLTLAKALETTPKKTDDPLFSTEDFIAYHTMLLGNTIAKSTLRYCLRQVAKETEEEKENG